MDEDGRLDVKHWDMTFEPSIREHHYHTQGLKFMSVLTDRDAGIFERNGPASDKKNSTSMEKEASMFPRDVGYVDRNSVYLQRDAQVAPFDYPRDGTSWNVQRSIPSGPVGNAKILQVIAENPLFSARDFHAARPLNTAYPPSFYEAQPAAEEPLKTVKHHHAAYRKREGEKESPSKSSEKLETKVAARPKKQKKQTACSSNGDFAAVSKRQQKSMDVVINGVIVDISTMPIPVCSCTGSPQQCYRWGNGGWQSACCTTSISMYPLPLNPKRRGARVAGRKMSGGAFKKLLERLGAEGHNLNYPIDLKSYWAKHGTNKFVTIR